MNVPNPNQKRDTITIQPQPPSEPPKGFNSGYWEKSQRFPVTLFVVGLGLIIVACLIIGGVGYVILQEDETPEPTDASVAEDATATPIIVGGGTDFAPIVQSPTATISPSPTVLDLATNTPDEEIVPTATFTFVPPSPLPPTSTLTATRTPTATQTPSPTSTFTATHTPTITLTASQTLTPSLTPLISDTPSPTVTPSLTSPPPTITPITNGHLLRLFYDNGSFYAWNGSTQQLRMSNLAFEAIDGQGNSVGYRFEGQLWAGYYPYLEASKCAALEVTTASSWLRPTQCWDYNAVLTPQDHYTTIFWRDRTNVTAFRVLWQEVEIGRCDVGRGECNVYVPR